MSDLIAKPLTDVISQDAEKLIEQSLQGQELAYQTLLKLALASTTNNDWQDFSGKPYLAGTGSKKIALRFNISLTFDRNAQNEPAFQREEFTKDDGTKLYVYTISGKASLSNGRTYEEIGTASTDDQFLGYETAKDEKGKAIYENGKAQKVAVPLHEAIQDAKKKCTTNFQGRAIQGILGLGGLTWDDLEKHGISQTGKSRVAFKTESKPKNEASQAKPAPVTPKGAPAWVKDYDDGSRWIYLKKGNHFGDDFIALHKLRETKTGGTFFAKWDDALWEAVENCLHAHGEGVE